MGALPGTLRRAESVVLVLLGLVVVAGSAFYAFVLPQTPGRLDRASAGLIDDLAVWSAAESLPVPGSGGLVAGLLALVVAAWLAAFAAALYLTWNRPATRRRLAATLPPAVLACVVSAFALPTANTDIFDYISFGRVAAVHDANPYDVPPSAFPDDPVYPYASPVHRVDPDNKLPAWMLLNRGLAEIAGDGVVTNLLVYRLALLVFSVGSLALVIAVTRRVFPAAALSAGVLFAWNPIVVVYGTAKTDTAMVFLFLLGLLALVSGRRGIAAVPLALSVFVKLITLPLIGLEWLRALAARQWRVLSGHVVAFVAVAAVVYAPFGGLDLFVEHVRLFTTGEGSDAPTAATPAAPVILLPLLPLVLLAIALLFVRNPSDARLLRSMGAIALAFGLLAVNPNSSWYLMTLVAVTAVAADLRLTAPAVGIAFGAFLLNSWHNASSRAFPLPEVTTVPRSAAYAVPLALLAVLAALLAVHRRRRRMEGEPVRGRWATLSAAPSVEQHARGS